VKAPSDTRALVLFSGGQDSTTCLAWSLARFGEVETVGFDYGQRHAVELACRPVLRDRLAELSRPGWGGLGPDHLIRLDALGQISETALTRDVEIATAESGLPTTFVPGRNILFMGFAAALAYRRGCRHIVLGVCETDYSGYPDCRDDTVKAMQVTLNLGLDARLVLHTPLMWMDKAATFALAEDLGGAAFLSAICEETHSCYRGDRSLRHDWGYGCAACPACELRAEGWRKFMQRRPVSENAERSS
jgi:7-cyano-7-deazaguanine synthase